MSLRTSFKTLPALALALAFTFSPALAQKTAINAPGGQAKGNMATAPQPKSPVVSAPQVVAPAPGLEAAGWLADLGAAQAQAKATNRPILAVFSGSDWCKPCIMYEQEVFAKPEFAAYAKDKLVLAHFDFPRQKRNQPTAAQLKLNETAAAQLNREGDFPLAVVLSPEGKVLAKTGYIAGGPAAFEAYLKKVVPTL
ncbi:thioredoxin family protein [Hymenobacter ruricola]|uniref:Thioredoxin family protein n=1 Tax=Hymenobacter ruricola TaxID=2791023 RepID=A0ABS0I008_9BACT|nr:thioredoxin family protein [Hymenobacter ruricola]MBF9219884.1 thioredoxin family protein [Hymenobacter ruricola]